jgi:hypothetical protein
MRKQTDERYEKNGGITISWVPGASAEAARAYNCRRKRGSERMSDYLILLDVEGDPV